MATSALESALSGLRVAQRQLSVISTNIANVQTPGYTRKIQPQSVRVIAGEAVGVTSDPVVRKVDLSLVRDLWTQVSQVSGFNAKIRYFDQIQQFHGPPDSGKAISAKIAELKDKFSALSDDPSNAFALAQVVDQASGTAKKFNDFSSFISRLRNDAEDEISSAIQQVNELLTQISEANRQIKSAVSLRQSSAAFEDLRDNAVQQLAELMNVSFFIRGDGTMVVQTKTGVQLTDEIADTLFFDKTNLSPDQYYPTNVNGIYIGGDPTVNPNATDIVPFDIGGRIGALVELRDTVLPDYQAQIDETAYRLAQRFENEGLRLFTDENGTLPADTAPVPNPPGPLTPVTYVGFSAKIQVNQDILDNPALLQTGTTGDPVQSGSNEVVRRVIEFTFGTTEYEQVEGSRDIRVVANPAGDTLQENLGLWSENRVVSTRNLAQYTTDMNVAPGSPFAPPSGNDTFSIRFFDTRLATDTGLISIDASVAAASYPIGSAGVGTGIGTVDNAAEQIASYINSLVWPSNMGVEATVNTYGQLVLSSRGNIEIDDGTMGAAGLDFLGLTAGTYDTTDPWFDIQVGNDPKVRITIAPGETETDLVNKIDTVPGIDTADIVINGSGHLSFRPQRGGDIKVIGGPFTSDAAGFSTAGGVPIIEELFGSVDPVVAHAHTAFRSDNLGPGVNLSTGIITGTSIIDFGQKVVNDQTQDIATAKTSRDNEEIYRSTLERQVLDQSGVNIDEELANMIVVQTAYAAAARAITTVNDLFRDLLTSIR